NESCRSTTAAWCWCGRSSPATSAPRPASCATWACPGWYWSPRRPTQPTRRRGGCPPTARPSCARPGSLATWTRRSRTACWWRRTAAVLPHEPPVPFEEQERVFASLRTALEEVHFLWGDTGDTLWHALRHLIGRAGPTAMEAGVLFGLARQIRWFARHGPRKEE